MGAKQSIKGHNNHQILGDMVQNQYIVGDYCSLQKPKDVALKAVVAYNSGAVMVMLLLSLMVALVGSYFAIALVWSMLSSVTQEELHFMNATLPLILFFMALVVSMVTVVKVFDTVFRRVKSTHITYNSGVLYYNNSEYCFGKDIWAIEKSRFFKTKLYVHYYSKEDGRPMHFIFDFANRSSAKYLHDRFYGIS